MGFNRVPMPPAKSIPRIAKVYSILMRRLLVTGGAGFIGSNFVHYLANRGDAQSDGLQIIVLDALTYAGNLENLKGLPEKAQVRFVEGDVRNWQIVEELVKNSDEVIHFAAESHVDRSISDPGIFIDTNVKGTLNLLDASKKHKKRMVLVSTDEVYGSLDSGFAKEEDILNPSSPYSASKASADLLALAYHRTYGLDVVVTRCSNNYGARQYPEKLIPLTIKRIIAGKKIPVYGQGSNIRDWIHVEDHCEGLYLALSKGCPGRVYNFGDVDQITNIEIVSQILTIMNQSTDLIEFVEDRLGHDFRYAIDASRARNELGWKAQRNLLSALPTVVNWYKNH
jgi:dTDP-glucose 4,6-dehydratase